MVDDTGEDVIVVITDARKKDSCDNISVFFCPVLFHSGGGGWYFRFFSFHPTDSIGYDVWVLKIGGDLDPVDGEFQWNTQFGTKAYDTPTSMVIDEDGFIYVTGTTVDNNDILCELIEESRFQWAHKFIDPCMPH